MLIVLFSTLLLSWTAVAAEDSSSSEEPHICEEAHTETDTLIDQTHGYLSRGILNITDGIDAFLGDDEIISDAKTSRGIIALTNRLTDGEGFSNQASFALQVRLPRTENRLKLVVDNISNQARNNEVEPTELDRLEDEAEDNDIAAALKFLFRLGPDWESDTNFGVKIGIPSDPFASVQLRRNFELAKWKLRFSQSIFWFNSSGIGEVTRGDIDFPLPKSFIFRFANSASYQFNEAFFRINNSFTVIHPLDKDRSLSYAAGASGDSQNGLGVQSYSAAVAYRQKILRKWIFMDIIPGFSWARANDFQPVASVALRFESVFGALDY